MKIDLQWKDSTLKVEGEKKGDQFSFSTPAGKIDGRIVEWSLPFIEVEIGKDLFKGALYFQKDFIDLHFSFGNFRLKYLSPLRSGAGLGNSLGELKAPMPGKILKILVGAGDPVQAGQSLMILEAMKMEHKILSPKDGKVQKIFFQEGERVGQDSQLLALE